MNAEYQRLEVQATECWQQLAAQAGAVTVSSAAEVMQLEEPVLREAMRLASMLFGMILVRSVDDEHAREQDREIADAISELTNRRRSKDQTTWLNYLITHGLNHRRMNYSRARHHHMPIGSGAIESTIRRVINLRVKGNAIYWLRENAETMIRLRAWIKAGRAEELFHQTTCVAPQLAL